MLWDAAGLPGFRFHDQRLTVVTDQDQRVAGLSEALEHIDGIALELTERPDVIGATEALEKLLEDGRLGLTPAACQR